MVSLIPNVSVIGPRHRSGTCAMWYGNRCVTAVYCEPKVHSMPSFSRTPPTFSCRFAVSVRRLAERHLRASTEPEARTRTPPEPHVPGRYGRIGKQLGPWSVRSRTVQRLLAPLLSGCARRMQQGGLDSFKADLEGPLAGFSSCYKGLCSLALAAFLTFLAWRFSFRLLDAAFLLLRPPLSFLAIGVSSCPACDDCGPPLCHLAMPCGAMRQPPGDGRGFRRPA